MQTWTPQRLHDLAMDRMRGIKLIVASNREPYIHMREDGHIRCKTPASGLTTALDPILRASGGVWVAHGSGNADWDVVDRRHHVPVPPTTPSYTLRRVFLPRQIEEEYYYGLANEGLWPLCHVAFHGPRFALKNWISYREANLRFADAILEEADGDAALAFIQDCRAFSFPAHYHGFCPQQREVVWNLLL